MAQIPRFDGRIGQSIDTGAMSPAGNMYVAPARTSSFEMLGQGVQQVASGVGALFKANAEREAANYVTKTSAQLQEATTKLLKEKEQAAFTTGNVDGFTENFMSEYDNLVNTSLKTAPNKFAQEAMQDRMMQARASMLGQVMKFEADTKVKVYRSNLDAAMNNYAKAAANDPNQIPQLLKQINGDFAAAQETLGLVEAQESARYYKNMVISSAVSNTLRTSPGKAEGILEQYKDELDAKQYNSLKNSTFYRAEQMRQTAEKMARAQAKQNQIWGAVNGGIAIDPTNKDMQKALDANYAQAKLQDPNFDYSDIAIKTGYMPSGMKNELAGKLANGSPLEQTDAAAKLMKMLEAKPQLVSKISAKEKAKAKMINDYMQSGISAEKAVQYATKHIYDPKDPELKERTKAAKDEGRLDFASVENDFVGGFFAKKVDKVFGDGVAIVPEQMKAEYEALARAYYIDEGLDADQASQMAVQEMKGRWHLSTVTGRNRFMKQAPELVFGNEAGTEWISEQLKAELTSRNAFEQLDNIMLQPSPKLSKNGLPVYQLFKVYDDGQIDAMFDNDMQPMLFQPSFTDSPAYMRMLNKYPGNTKEEKEANYLKEVTEQKQKNEAIGQPADLNVTLTKDDGEEY